MCVGGFRGRSVQEAVVQPVKRMAMERVAADYTGVGRRAADKLKASPTVLTSPRGILDVAPTQMKTLLGGA